LLPKPQNPNFRYYKLINELVMNKSVEDLCNEISNLSID